MDLALLKATKAVSIYHCEVTRCICHASLPQLFDSLLCADHWTVLMASITASAREDHIASCVDLLLSRKADPNVADR